MEDIITALATAWGEGGIAVVRLSGEGSVKLADKIFEGKKKLADMPARFLTLGRLRSAEGDFFDEVLAVRFDRGASYTATGDHSPHRNVSSSYVQWVQGLHSPENSPAGPS